MDIYDSLPAELQELSREHGRIVEQLWVMGIRHIGDFRRAIRDRQKELNYCV